MLNVRPVVEDDVPALAELFAEMDQFYGAAEIEPAQERERQILAMVFGEQSAAQVLVAHADDRLVGFASYCFLWPAVGLTKSLFLKELFVSAKAQRRGTGTSLMQHLFCIAEDQMCSRVEWMTDRENLSAQRFYEGLSAPVAETKIVYRVPIA